MRSEGRFILYAFMKARVLKKSLGLKNDKYCIQAQVDLAQFSLFSLLQSHRGQYSKLRNLLFSYTCSQS
jgi:hypothetical protein